MESTIILSVVLPNYNHARFLKRRFDSILLQTHQNFELIILDDCSTDNSVSIIEYYCQQYPHIIRFYPNTTNSGSPFKQWQKGIELARGEYIWIAESDDYCSLYFLEKCFSVLRSQQAGLVFAASMGINEQEDFLLHFNFDFYKNKPAFTKSQFFKGELFVMDYLSQNNYIFNASAVIFRKNLFYQITDNSYNTFKLAGDWLFWIQICQATDIYFIADELNYFRYHPQTARAQFHKKAQFLQEKIYIYKYLQQYISLAQLDSLKQQIQKEWLRIFRQKNDDIKNTFPDIIKQQLVPIQALFKLFRPTKNTKNTKNSISFAKLLVLIAIKKATGNSFTRKDLAIKKIFLNLFCQRFSPLQYYFNTINNFNLFPLEEIYERYKSYKKR